ncbi:hypothetical protein K8R03_00370 [Candidatus Kaiserbacteria bacterium]|nr:hypothetical protein [Candidatus Kaiserbacteria bacterium]
MFESRIWEDIMAIYIEWTPEKTVHIGVHHEMLLLASPVWGRRVPEVPIHIHKHPVTGECFVCWTPQVADLEQARKVFRWWCVGTVYAIEQSEDFAPLVGAHQDDFLEFMVNEFGIEIVE